MTVSYHRQPDKANRALLLKFALVAAIMFAFGYLLVPLYDQICRLRPGNVDARSVHS